MVTVPVSAGGAVHVAATLVLSTVPSWCDTAPGQVAITRMTVVTAGASDPAFAAVKPFVDV